MPASSFRVAALASRVTALTTLALIFLPDLFAPVSDGLAGRIERVRDPAYRLRAWIAFVHPFLAFAAALAVAVALRPGRPALALVGVFGFALWAVVETAQQAMTLFAFDAWRQAWLAGDPAVRQAIATLTVVYDGLWEAAYNLLLIGFLLGCASFAAALLCERDVLGRVVGAFYAVATLLTLALLAGQLGAPLLPDAATKWLYAVSQPLARLLIGIWLWRNAGPRSPA